jgi:hypothetical protein
VQVAQVAWCHVVVFGVERNLLLDTGMPFAIHFQGIVAKRKRGVYKDDGKDWLKVKNPNYSKAEERHDLLKHKR